MPSADFCDAIRGPHGLLSPPTDTTQISRGKSHHLHRTPAGSTAWALDGYGLRDLLLTRPAKAASYPIPVRRVAALLHAAFRPHLTMTPLRFANTSPPSGCVGDLHPQVMKHARHTEKAGREARPRWTQRLFRSIRRKSVRSWCALNCVTAGVAVRSAVESCRKDRGP